jgi:hypothetical protein
MTLRLAIVLALLPAGALAPTRTYRDTLGREVGRSTTSGNTTTFQDGWGHQTGRSVRNGNGNVTTYDASGRQIGTITKGR